MPTTANAEHTPSTNLTEFDMQVLGAFERLVATGFLPPTVAETIEALTTSGVKSPEGEDSISKSTTRYAQQRLISAGKLVQVGRPGRARSVVTPAALDAVRAVYGDMPGPDMVLAKTNLVVDRVPLWRVRIGDSMTLVRAMTAAAAANIAARESGAAGGNS